jgi:hypothetical protein
VRRRSISSVILPVCFLFAIVLGSAQDLAALPRYSASYGKTCAVCHRDPAGGGMRTVYATQLVVPADLVMKQYRYDEFDSFNPQIGSKVSIGLDQRTIVHEGDGDDGDTGIIAMQGDLYLSISMDQRFSAYTDIGQSGVGEYFGLAKLLPANGYVKVGRFTPPYGWRFADHQTAVRRYLLSPEGTNFPSRLTDSGIEIGFYPGPVAIAASLIAGGADNGESYSVRGVVRESLGSLKLTLGSSILKRRDILTDRRAYGLFGYAAIGRLVWVWEVDQASHRRRDEPETYEFLFSQELAWRLQQGLWVRGTYSFHDPHTELATGSRARWGVGVDSLIYPFFGVQLMGNYYQFETGLDVAEEDRFQAELTMHFLF